MACGSQGSTTLPAGLPRARETPSCCLLHAGCEGVVPVPPREAGSKRPELLCSLFVRVCHLLPSKINCQQDGPLALRNRAELLHLSTRLRKAVYIDFIFTEVFALFVKLLCTAWALLNLPSYLYIRVYSHLYTPGVNPSVHGFSAADTTSIN